jgi:hypothetical protein
MLEDSIMKSQILFEKGRRGEEREYNRGRELVQSTLYTSMEISK